jgi:hypothetical protein
MSATHSRASFLAATRRRGSYGDLRISDAERAEVVDLLAAHYGDGRLDQAEFDQRLDQAMKARTYKDLSGLFADLPPLPATGEAEGSELPARLHRGRPPHRVLLVAFVIAVAIVAGHVLAFPFNPWAWTLGPWLWIGLIAVIAVLVTRGRSRKGAS